MAKLAPHVLGASALSTVREVPELDPDACDDREIVAEEMDNLLFGALPHAWPRSPSQKGAAESGSAAAAGWVPCVASSALLALAMAAMYLLKVEAGQLKCGSGLAHFLHPGGAKVGYRWHQKQSGEEVHREVGELLEGLDSSTEGYRILSLAAPEPQRCRCKVERFGQYAMCSSAVEKASKAISLGVNGYDHWGFCVNRNHDFEPDLYDCYNQAKPTSFPNHFNSVCVGTAAGNRGGRKFTTLSILLSGAAPRSVLLKLDIEEAEFDVLGVLSAEDFAKIASLHVEYHFNQRAPTEEDLRRGEAVLRRVREHLAVIDAGAGFYGKDVIVGEVSWPRLLVVSYAASGSCS